MFSAMLTDAYQDGDNGIPIRYRFDGKLFNLRRLQAKSKVQTEVLDEFLFADDIWQRVLQQKRKCKKVWIKYLIHVTAMISQSASKRLISARTWKALQGAYHHRERSTTASGRQVHLPWKHIG